MWRLTTSEGGGPWLRSANGFLGRQVWEYDPDTGTSDERAEVDRLRADYTKHRFHRKESQDLLLRLQYAKLNPLPVNIPTLKLDKSAELTEEILSTSLRRALNRFSTLQADDGHWPGDYSGLLFIMPIIIFSLYVTGSLHTVLSLEHRREIIRYIYNHQIIGVYEWSGNNPIIPELWLVPDFLPIHPGRFWCFTRLVYMSMAYLYGKKFVGPITTTILALRDDLYNTAYEKVNWDKARHSCAKALLRLSKISPKLVGDPISQERLYDAIDCLLSFMVLNPSESFRNIVVDYPSVECTSSALDALVIFKDMYPQYRRGEIENCIKNASLFIEKSQRKDGAWYGTWGICFTYGTMFAVRGLVAAGRTYDNSHSIRKACSFLLSNQQNTGGWGESYISSDIEDYVDSGKPNAVNTSFAMLALIYAGQLGRDPLPVYQAARLLINIQLGTGEFPQQEHIGCFNSSLYFNYANYRNIFPILALGELRGRIMAKKN
ncbi:hypothetical protein QYE76_039402 [Lolium multiflorum]|uniref:Squalene cyclase C-terminal domain-containing protein n=1 Tax=Lolium multiflorum TaxID=4521 RepID=A0AAD8TB18_LOLMU|nr:hypothetical protein QYE76_039402 [Lolium multiflorum]